MENQADNLWGRHMWISAYTNIQQQSQGTWMSCSMHKIRSCAHTLHRDQESGVQDGLWSGARNVEEAFQGMDSFI